MHDCTGGNAENANTLGIRSNTDILDCIGLAVIARGEECKNCPCIGFIACIVSHTANGGIISEAAAIQVVILHPIQIQVVTLDIIPAVHIFTIGQIGISVVQAIIIPGVFKGNVRTIGIGPVVPVDVLELGH